jgi:hypothetical protein
VCKFDRRPDDSLVLLVRCKIHYKRLVDLELVIAINSNDYDGRPDAINQVIGFLLWFFAQMLSGRKSTF